MITIYAPEAQDFSTLGLGALAPYECTVEEQAGGMYELTMSHPMDEAGKWLNIGVGCIVKAPAPVRETPLADEDADGEIPTEPVTVTRKIYKVQTNTGANLHLRQGPSTSTRILSKYRPGTEVVVLSQASGWGQVIVCSSGATGYMSMQYLVHVRDETETIAGDAPSPERVVYPVQSRMQLFRIFKVERDAAEREVRVEARHIFYDLLGDPTKNEYAPEGVAAGTVVEQLFDRALNPHGFDVHCQLTGTVTGEYTRRGLVECLLDPDDGVVPQTNGRLIRDNFDIWLLPDLPRETGVTIRHGKNLLGATLTTDWDSLVTRIIPVGQDKEGKALLLEGTTYMDSPHIGDYPVICAQAVEYDVKIGQEGIDNAAQARAKLQELAEADFSDNGVDLPTVGLDVDFVALGETEEYRQYADLEAVHLYDTVRVIAKSAGIDAAVRVTGYKWDALGRKYESVTLGEITDLKTTVYGYELPNQGIKTVKIAPGAVGSAQLRELAVQYAHINTAAVEQLSANSITALKAYIHELVAESITTDQLYADLATIALAQITTANIENANIDWASIGTLVADVAEIAKAHLGDVDIDWAQIDNLTAAVAEIAKVEIGEAVIDGAQITDGTITNAKIENAAIDTAKIALGAITTALIATGAVGTAQIADGSITDAKIVSLNADVINAGTLSVDRLLLKGPDGLFVAINATDEGLTSEQLSQEEYQSAISGTVLVARSVTADKIAAKSITANEIAAGAITTAELAAESVDASKIKAGSITTSHVAANFGETLDISSNKQVEIIAGDVQQAQETADSAQEAAEQAAPYISATPPEEAPEAGKLWLDEGVEPSVLRKWRGADVPTEREYTETRVGCGKNLLDITKIDNRGQPDTIVEVNGNSVRIAAESRTWGCGRTYLYLLEGVYTIAADITVTKGEKLIGRRVSTDGGQTYPSVLTQSTDTGEMTFTIHSGEEWNQFTFFCSGGTAEEGDVTYSNIRLYAGTDATEYEPYEDIPFLALDNAQGQISQVEAEVGCDVTPKNMIDINSLTTTTNTNISVATDQLRVYTTGEGGTWKGGSTGGFVLRKGISYTLSAQLVEYVSGDAYIAIRNASDNTIISALSLDFGTTPARMSKTYTPDSNMRVYFTAFCSNNTVLKGDVTYRGIQLEVGDEATSYEKYKGLAGKDQICITACGKNLINLDDLYLPNSNTEMSTSEDGVRIYTTGDGGTYRGARTPTFWIRKGVSYTLSAELANYVSGNARAGLRNAGTGTFLNEATVSFGSTPGTLTKTFTPESDEEVYFSMLSTNGTVLVGDCTFADIQLEIGNSATEYEPYRSIGGGTVTPDKPLYGLPGAKDTVEVAVDGDVTVARRTAMLELDGTETWGAYATAVSGEMRFRMVPGATPGIQPPPDNNTAANLLCSHYLSVPATTGGTYDCVTGISIHATEAAIYIYDERYSDGNVETWKAYLAAQKTAGTPVTIVYELAAPETEALTAVAPIAPQPGQVNILTDADALTATIYGSGWETVNDTSDLREGLDNAQGDISGMLGSINTMRDNISAMASQILSPDEIVTTVTESNEWQSQTTQVTQNGEGLALVQTTVSDLGGRMDTMEGVIVIDPPNIDIGVSDSNTKLHLDNEGWDILSGGSATISARENKVVAPRFRVTDALMIGGLAFRVSNGHLYLLKNGG